MRGYAMTEYNFYYDESEHSRKINFNTVSAANYYDNFVAMIVGWPIEGEDILQQYAAFETKYAGRKDRNGEIKSTMLQQKQFRYGFASLNKPNAQFINEFLELFDKDIHIYFSVCSKIEYLVLQLFHDYKNRPLVDADLMKYSITTPPPHPASIPTQMWRRRTSLRWRRSCSRKTQLR